MTAVFLCLPCNFLFQILKCQELVDGSINVVSRGQQRFRLRRQWIDVEGAVCFISCHAIIYWASEMSKYSGRCSFFLQPCAEVQIIEEDTPLRTPKGAFGRLASTSNPRMYFSHPLHSSPSPAKRFGHEDAANYSECMSIASTGSDHSDICTRICQSTGDSPSLYERIDASSSSDEELLGGRRQKLRKSLSCRSGGSGHSKKSRDDDGFGCDSVNSSPEKGSTWKGGYIVGGAKYMCPAPLTFWPCWVYQMYDSYALAWRAAGNVPFLSIFPCAVVYIFPYVHDTFTCCY